MNISRLWCDVKGVGWCILSDINKPRAYAITNYVGNHTPPYTSDVTATLKKVF